MKEGAPRRVDTHTTIPLRRVGAETRKQCTQRRELFLDSLSPARTFEGISLLVQQYAVSVPRKKETYLLADSEELISATELSNALREVEVSFHADKKEVTKDTIRSLEIFIPSVISAMSALKEKVLHLAYNRLESSLQYRHGASVPVGESSEAVTVHSIEGKDQNHQKPVVIVPGFRSGPESFEEFALDVSSSGRHTSVLDVAATPKVVDESLDFPEGTPPLLAAHASATSAGLQHIHETVGEKVDLVGHSLGAMSATLAARAHPQLVKSLTLINPAGMPGSIQKYPRLARLVNMGWLRKSKETAQQQNLAKKDAVIQTRQEIDEAERQRKLAEEEKGTDVSVGDIVSGFSIAPYLEELLAQGIQINIVITSEDYMFPSKHVRQEAEKHGVSDRVIEQEGSHNAIKYEPGKVAATTEACLEN